MCARWKGEHREKWLSDVWTERGKKATRCMGRTREEKLLSGVWTEHESNKWIGPEWVWGGGHTPFYIVMVACDIG